ncbi:MAG: acyl-CoA thioesterase [Aquabacterium sp.]
MSHFDDDTRLQPLAEGTDATAGRRAFSGTVSPAWNIGANPNGGYLLALVTAALRHSVPQHPDPLSITVHYLRPGLPAQPLRIDTHVLRSGRTLSTVRATLQQEGGARLEVLAAMGHLGEPSAPVLALEPPAIPPPLECIARSADEQGVALPILDRLDIRLHPQQARAGSAGQARISGWIRLADGRAPDTGVCPLFIDAFPPAVFGLLGMVGWVPTVELTVHLRRRPAPGWMLGAFHTQDLSDGRVIEDGALWDADGQLVAQARQLALVRMRETTTPSP